MNYSLSLATTQNILCINRSHLFRQLFWFSASESSSALLSLLFLLVHAGSPANPSTWPLLANQRPSLPGLQPIGARLARTFQGSTTRWAHKSLQLQRRRWQHAAQLAVGCGERFLPPAGESGRLESVVFKCADLFCARLHVLSWTENCKINFKLDDACL